MTTFNLVFTADSDFQSWRLCDFERKKELSNYDSSHEYSYKQMKHANILKQTTFFTGLDRLKYRQEGRNFKRFSVHQRKYTR